MEVIYGREKLALVNKQQTGVGLGNFDGLHIGHMALINTLIAESKKSGLTSLVYTFSRHPEDVIAKENSTPIITTVQKKSELLAKTSLDYLCFDEFDECFSKMEPEDFIKNIIIGTLNAKLAVVGFNYRFGHKGKGNPDMLRDIGNKYNLKVEVIPPIKVNDEIVSSTLIRTNIFNGNMEKVSSLLGRNYSIRGKVGKGRHVGSQLGFPTANIYPEKTIALPKYGVYITVTKINGKEYQSITNVGMAPTFGLQKKVSVETFIFDFNDDVYQKEAEIFFLSQLREERKFNSVEELVEQINKDILEGKKYFSSKGEYTTE
ncbi:MAG TPA: bifunctional riboflavin kinase/FAD synthetase [Clostridiaceae bacterium]|nr:bifunctional riboflavin kinase/FAD synthetase [Clostridiaceae bacterium]